MTRQRFEIHPRWVVIAAYVWLLLVAVAVWFTSDVPTGTLAVVPLLFIAYHTRRLIAIATALIVGVTFAYVHLTGPSHSKVPSVIEYVIITVALVLIVLVAESLRRRGLSLEERLALAEQAAHRDTVTDLPNRLAFVTYLNKAITFNEGTKVAVLFADLNGFKEVNDMHGHHIGDRALSAAGARMRHLLRESDIVARLGGDEFGIVIHHINSREDVQHVVNSIKQVFATPVTIEMARLTLGISIGVGIYPDDAKDVPSLLEYADRAMYADKRLQKALSQSMMLREGT